VPASVLPGDPLALYVRAARPAVRVEAFRLGWYGGAGARRVWQTELRVPPEPPPVTVDAATRTVAAGWTNPLQVGTAGWSPGAYLFRLTAQDGAQRWVPFTVRSATTAGTVVLLSANTTWQAYNAWGGYSLYKGPNGHAATRAYAVSFDRPYDYGDGAADFAGNERPVVGLAERYGIPVAYEADTDLNQQPHLLDGARAVFSLGHDEYWSRAMRNSLLAAREAGTNLAFLGANAVYRHIRLGALPTGPDRLETDYKSGADPLARTDPSDATYDWPHGPHPRPENDLTGALYQCNPVRADMLLVDPGSWLVQGLALSSGARLTDLVGSEYDGLPRGLPAPGPVDVLFHSPVRCGHRPSSSDVVYYTTAGGAAGFDASTSSWVCVLADTCEQPRRITQLDKHVVTIITLRLLRAFAAGPAGTAHPVAAPFP
jgi:hypothetical protein